nr:hypothetical protein [Tanacetum cinerariifolium]
MTSQQQKGCNVMDMSLKHHIGLKQVDSRPSPWFSCTVGDLDGYIFGSDADVMTHDDYYETSVFNEQLNTRSAAERGLKTYFV